MPYFEPRSFPRTARALAFAGLFALLHLPGDAADETSDVIGQWRFTKPLDSSEITALDDDGARRLVGKVFTISREKIKFGTRECLPPSLEEHWVEPRLYLREQAHASAENLHLPNPVAVVELGCTIAFVRDRNRLVIHWKGWFFDAVRVRKTSGVRKQG